MEKVKAYIYREKNGTYSIYVDEKANINYGLIGEGDTVENAIQDWENCYEAMKLKYAQRNKPFKEVEFSYIYDVASFLSYFNRIFTLRGLSKITGISAAQLSQYVNGYRNPSHKTTEKIQQGLNNFVKELSQVHLL